MGRHKDNAIHIGIDDSEEKVDKTLIREYGYDLFDFAYSLAIVSRKNPPIRLYNIWKIKSGCFEQLALFRAKVKSLERLKDSIIKRLETHLKDIGYWEAASGKGENQFFPTKYINKVNLSRDGGLIPEEKRRATIKIYELDRTLKVIDAEIFHYKELFSIFSKGQQGRTALSKTIIFSIWSYAMTCRHKMNLEIMVELFYWFLRKIGNTSYGKKMDESILEKKKGLISSEEISRFKRIYGEDLLKDFIEIFGYNNKIFSYLEKPRTLQIRFDNNEPKFFTIEEDTNKKIPRIIFPI